MSVNNSDTLNSFNGDDTHSRCLPASHSSDAIQSPKPTKVLKNLVIARKNSNMVSQVANDARKLSSNVETDQRLVRMEMLDRKLQHQIILRR